MQRSQLQTSPLNAALHTDSPDTSVEHVYPSGPVLPANVTRLYLEFSAPMDPAGALDHVRLVDTRAGHHDGPGLIDAGLWDPERRRLTLVLRRPGKDADETPLRPGRRYRLVVDPAWRDARGRPLAGTFEHAFRVRGRVDEPLDPSRWHVATPQAGSRDPLVVLLPRPLDYGLLRRAVGVRDPHGVALNGVVTIDRNERRWQFTPTRPWQPGTYTVVADHALEDPAGNRIPPDEHPHGVHLEHVISEAAIY
ncbi:MAG TPA: hypothetical protein VF198_02830 [Vicinamibacterales bacterium]